MAGKALPGFIMCFSVGASTTASGRLAMFPIDKPSAIYFANLNLSEASTPIKPWYSPMKAFCRTVGSTVLMMSTIFLDSSCCLLIWSTSATPSWLSSRRLSFSLASYNSAAAFLKSWKQVLALS